MRCPVTLLCAGVACFAADLAPEVLLLQQARTLMSQNLDRLPNYTCLQTIERTERRAPKRKPRLVDVVRLEVALVNGREMFAWPGSRKFVDTELRDLAPGGAIGNGVFALFAKAVFQTGVPRFTYAGEFARPDRETRRWDFVVALPQSGYKVRVNDQEATVGYHGSIWVDKATLDLVRMEVHADDIPLHLKLLSAGTSVEYARTPIGGETFLLPVSSELYMTGLDGSTSENRTRFGSCRQYTGESTLLFEEPQPESEKHGPLRVLQAPADLQLQLELQAPVVIRQAAVGDPVTAVLRKEVRVQPGVAIPRGALVHGRIASLREQQAYRAPPAWAIGLKFFEMESGNTRVEFSATLEEVQTAQPGFRSRSSFGSGLRTERPENEDVTGSVFFVQSTIQRLERGLRMMWRTRKPQPDEKQPEDTK